MTTKFVYLRALEESDLDLVHKWHNDPELYKSLVGPFHFISRKRERIWLEDKQSNWSREVNLAICLKVDRSHIGNIYLHDIHCIHRRAELSIFIGEAQQRGKGYGNEAVHQVIEHAFLDLGLQRLYLLVLKENAPAIKAYKKNGFQIEGELRHHVFKHDKFKDVMIMGLCKNEWLAQRG